MKYAVNSKEMKIIEEHTIGVAGIPAIELMERAAQAVVDTVILNINKEDRICIVCGKGNNGGDGAAIGRLLFLQGYNVTIYLIGDGATPSYLLHTQLEKARNLGVPIENTNKLNEYNVIIDSIFGIGLTRAVSGTYENIINEINNSENMVFAVDIPSGISADDGKVYNVAVRADQTITFGFMKKGLLLYPGAEYAGKITVADIGFPTDAILQADSAAFYYEPEDLALLPTRKNYSHKGTYGKVLVIAGSKGMSGAAFLSAKAAYRSGAGLVKVLTSEANRVIMQTLLPEALFSSYDGEDESDLTVMDKLHEHIQWASVVIIGPGLGKGDIVQKLLDYVLSEAKVPVLIDADAINILAKMLDKASIPEHMKRLHQLSLYLRAGTIITPHLMELSRLTGYHVTHIKDNLIDTAYQCSYNNEIIYIIKDARTIIAQNGNCYINISGNNGMATGGSGDVLTGIIGALIAQGMNSFEASTLGVYIHGLAGDEAALENGAYSMMAGDIVEVIGKVIKYRKG